ncbi:MerR family transcriptional regulator [Sinosporangium siamense]|uniref:MerR family transcriptional regulator n=1 Tax=Sinosporangium siamense TaxID=1367973 RepID=A0A919V9Z1_9ACTN|nr:MerR family transcriptional regulator [Sinosporangium siamense]GII94847.1 MerR family transcriptional regulator [Sinosporangium siamense]
MITIGDFARLGLVSVRMLRHYDAIGLLQPAYVDPGTGYRFYTAVQLPQLNRIIALKELGFTLEQVRAMLEGRVTGDGLSGMLNTRRTELRERITADTERLSRVEGRLRMIEREGNMNNADVLLKTVDSVRAAEVTGLAASYSHEHIGPVVGSCFDTLIQQTEEVGLAPVGPLFAYYENSVDGVVVHAAFPVAATTKAEYPFAVVDLPGFAAATTVHRGPVREIGLAFQSLAAWMEEHNHRSTGFAREVYLHSPPDCPDQWVTELQERITPQDDERRVVPGGLVKQHSAVKG